MKIEVCAEVTDIGNALDFANAIIGHFCNRSTTSLERLSKVYL